MKERIIRTIMRPLLIVGVVLGLIRVVEADVSNIDFTNKYAWGTNVGWINFNPTLTLGVTVYDDHLEGYAWGENIGWIRLGTYEGGDAHTYGNSSMSDYGVNNDGSGNLSGYAWSAKTGWINFNPDGSEQVVAYDDHLEGYAWAENVGWIRFGTETGGGAHSYGNTSNSDYGVNQAPSGHLTGYAWGTNVGWINFGFAQSGVTVYPDHLEGDAWGENVGWIRMGSHTGGGTHTYANTSTTNYGVNREPSGDLSGYAWGTNIGWINFNPAEGGVSIDPETGSFSGYAWGENIGWIHFENTGANAYNVVVLTADLVITKTVSVATAQPGETISYQLVFANNGDATATDVIISDLLPITITNSSVVSSGVTITQTNPSYVWEVEDLAPSQGGVITITGEVSDALTSDTIITNSATITTSGLEGAVNNNSSQVSFTVTVPRIQFDSNSYTVAEDGGTAMITVTLDSANPYADVKATVVSTDGSATAGSDYSAISSELTIPAGSTSSTISVPITDDMLDESDETLQLSLTNPVGGALGSTDSTTLTIINHESATFIFLPILVRAP